MFETRTRRLGTYFILHNVNLSVSKLRLFFFVKYN